MLGNLFRDKSMLLGVLKPLLPKLEGFLNDQELKDGEKAEILLNTNGKNISIKIIAIKEIDNQIVITRILQDITEKL
tara:strand:- start:313 stop:543 length:231 start_codon:yes stop_codon:yes gene_type:complete